MLRYINLVSAFSAEALDANFGVYAFFFVVFLHSKQKALISVAHLRFSLHEVEHSPKTKKHEQYWQKNYVEEYSVE